MFGSNNKKSQENMPTNQGGSSINTIGNGTIIEGQIKCKGDIRIDGKINGTITSEAKVVIGTTGNVEGDIECKNSDVSGRILGKLKVDGLLFLKATAVVEGEVVVQKLVVDNGAKLIANIKMPGATQRNIKSAQPSNNVEQKVALK